MNFDYHGHELFISQIQDQIRLCNLRYQCIMTSFLTIPEQEIVKSIVGKNAFLGFWGGHEKAQRKIACFMPYEGSFEYDLVILESSLDHRFRNITHRDVLGALMNLGIEREMLGDLIVEQDRIIIFCKESLADFICMECNRISSCSVHFQRIEHVEIQTPLTKEILVHSASLRLDAIVSGLAHTSRSEASAMIKRGYVKLNDIVLEENRQLCNNDFVSIRKCGRFQFKEIKSTTKKNRLILRFEQYI